MRLEARDNPRVEQRPSQRLEAALSKITRAILNFNGTQYATLSEPVVLDGDFEIECIGTLADFISSGFWGGYKFGLLTDSEGVLRFVLPREDIAETPRYTPIGELTYLDLNKINSISVGRRGNEFFMCLNNQSEKTQTLTDIDNALSVHYMGVMDLGSGLNRHLDGSIFSTRIWKDGDRFTGELVTNLRFDEPNTTLQRNYAYPNSNFLYNSETDDPFPLRTGAGQGEGVITTLPNGTWELRRADTYTSGMIGARIDYVNLPPGRYKFYFEGAREGNVAFMIRRRSNGQDYDFFSLDDPKEGWFDHDDPQGLYIQVQIYNPSETSFARIDKFYIQEWDGIELQNALPGDWEKISQKSGDDFWLGVELSQVSSSELLGDDSDPEFQDVAPVVAGYVYEAYAAVSPYSGIADTGWSTGGALGGSNTGIPGEPPFRVGKPDIGSIVGGIFYSQENNIVRLYGRSTSIAGFSNISIKRYLEYAEGAL